jgi:hypothetical protein
MPQSLLFLTSTRFYALVIGSLAIASQGGFSREAWTNAVITFVSGFIGIRSLDRATEVLSSKKLPEDVK